MEISGIIVSTQPNKKESVITEIDKMENVEVHDSSLDYKIVALIEAGTPGDAAVIFKNVHDIKGVLNVSMVCNYSTEEGGMEN